MLQQELFPEDTKFTARDPRKHCDSLFYALMPHPRAARHLTGFAWSALSTAGQTPDNWTFLETGRLHLSLQSVREQYELEEKYAWLGKQVAQKIMSPAFELTFDAMGTFPPIPSREDHRPFILLGDNSALRELFQRLGAEMCRMGWRAHIDFEPHLTLAYGPHAVPFQHIVPIRLLFTEFVLIKSAKGSHHYDICGRWPLLGG
ncbi:MAG TPA: 2'-5' RNA ligase family protein [Terriglobales bacterium]|nr:2'-5' RNA ligase family protein [Terriglobales bacterium]